MKIKSITLIVLSILVLSMAAIVSNAAEPVRPSVDYEFTPETDTEIKNLETLPVENAFDALKKVEFITNEKAMNKAVYVAFNRSENAAIAHALNQLRIPAMQNVDGRLVKRTDSLYVAKKIFHIFPEESTDDLINLYESGNETTKANILYVLGRMPGGDAVRETLISALDDRSLCEELHPEIAGLPLRICDIAYNELVLRYDIRDVLRTLGNIHRAEVRDYHIAMLKDVVLNRPQSAAE
ncbi:MAG: hypothetical protein M0P57_13110 [Syntrophales bacterium]|nr:hypothetical protein [Syntrophales bacterium]MDY0044452.1 hypothetical protein [Syntrophales bacterium]